MTEQDQHAFPAALWRRLERLPVPTALTQGRWRSPLRGPWLTSVLGAALLVGLPIVTITGLFSYIAYGPQFGQALPHDVGWLHLPYFDWPTHPAWLYQLNQGVHVNLGLTLIPIVLAKLWSVVPKLFVWPPARSLADVLERLSLLMLVGGLLFEIVTGVLNIQYDYVFGFDFYTAHYYGAWVFIVGLVVHLGLKLPTMVRSLRSRSMRAVLRTSRADTVVEDDTDSDLVATAPAPATLSRRGLLGTVLGGSVMIAVLSVGQSIGGPARRFALLLPRGRSYGSGPNDFQVNRTADAAGIQAADTGAGWRLTLTGARRRLVLDRDRLLAMPQHTATMPIACVEGWASTQTWTGVRLAELARLAGVPSPDSAFVQSIERGGAFSSAVLEGAQVLHPDALLALQVNGADLSPDHGYPARVIVPALPGVHNTKWVGAIDFRTVRRG